MRITFVLTVLLLWGPAVLAAQSTRTVPDSPLRPTAPWTGIDLPSPYEINPLASGESARYRLTWGMRDDRPWWRYPLIGAGIGLAIGGVYALHGYQECRSETPDELCELFVVVPPVGLAVGATAGVLIHFVVR